MDCDTQNKKGYTITDFVDIYSPRKADKTKEKRISSTMTNFQLSRIQIQPTVRFIQVLKPDQHNPNSYRKIIVKIGGYPAYFIDLG